jgi:hypothetical protein
MARKCVAQVVDPPMNPAREQPYSLLQTPAPRDPRKQPDRQRRAHCENKNGRGDVAEIVFDEKAGENAGHDEPIHENMTAF